jgi:hypothetical protein
MGIRLSGIYPPYRRAGKGENKKPPANGGSVSAFFALPNACEVS